jgi:Family of unknown function (DUF6098)
MAPLENPVEIDSLDVLAHLVLTAGGPLYVRFSSGLERDGADGSIDHESGLALPGLSVNPLRPPSWWRGRSVEEWIGRQIRAYHHLKEHDDDRRCWVVTGTVIDRGPDNEPLLTDVAVIAVVAEELVQRCGQRESESRREEDLPDDDGSAPWQSA